MVEIFLTYISHALKLGSKLTLPPRSRVTQTRKAKERVTHIQIRN
jgi:hypothetical protein